MFRKIHSNRNPQDTLWSSLGTEFAVHLNQAKLKFRTLLKSYPNYAFALMVLLLLGSVSMMLITSRNPKPKSQGLAEYPVNSSAQNGLSTILTQADGLRESLRLKDEVQLLIAKDSLTHADTIHLEKAIDRLHHLTIKSSTHVPN